LEEIDLRRDAAIDKTENLAREVKIDEMIKTFDSLMGKTQNEKVAAIVAEPIY
jgi:adenosylmethionine-8-amino-7-oxononanoate aminotransferase